MDQAEAADPTLFDTDPIQPGEVQLHLWMLYTPQAPILDLTGEHIKTKEDIKAAFHALNLCSQEEEELKSDGRKERRANSQSKSLTYSDSSDDNEVNPQFKMSEEKRQYITIPGSAIATHIALSYSGAQANPTME